MTVKELIEILSNLPQNKDVAVCPDKDSDGIDFTVENSEFCVFLVGGEWGGIL